MKVLVTGVAGQLGYDVRRELIKRGHECIGSDLAAGDAPMDITDAKAALDTLTAVRPDAVIHCAAWTAVDAAEDEPEQAHAVNAGGTRNIAGACAQLGCKMVYISTDYVFDGSGSKPWKPEDRCFRPLNVYGRTKLEGETAVAELTEKYFIVRIEWAFGVNGDNFIKTMLRVGAGRDEIRVVSDQIGALTYTPDLAGLLVDMIETEKYGYYHAANEGGFVSRCDLVRELFRQAGLKTKVIPVTTEEYGPTKAVRPLNSRFDTSKLAASGFTPLPDWKDAIGRYLKEINK